MSWILLLSIWSIVNFCVGISRPRISIYPCKVPVANEIFSICCKAENVYTAPITFFRDNIDNVITSWVHRCHVTSGKGLQTWDCQTFEGPTVIRLIMGQNTTTSVGLWGCYYYGGMSTYSLTTDKVVTNDSGYIYVELYHDVTLTWTINGGGHSIILPDDSPLPSSGLNYSVTTIPSSGSTKVELILSNVSKHMNGTYICISQNNERRDALTLIVMEKPSAPSISVQKISFSGQYMTTDLSCETNHSSAGPPYYVPQLNTSWLYSTPAAAYTAYEDSTYLIVKDLDCNLKHSRPVFCALKEGTGEWSPRGYLHPHTLCNLKPTVAPTFIVESEKPSKTATIVIVVIIISIMAISMFIYVYYIYKRRRQQLGLTRCEFVESCCVKFRDTVNQCCPDECCKRHTEGYVYENDLPALQEIQREQSITENTNENDLQNIFNLYNVLDTPTEIPQQQIPTTQNADTSNPGDDVAMGGYQGHDNGSFVTHNDVLQDDNEADSAPAINQSALVLELETCLRNLSRLIDPTENHVQVRRSHIIEDMMNIYTDPDILKSSLHIKLIGEQGSDWGGVSRDVFTTFWNESSSVFFHGDSIHVPYLSLVNMERENQYLILGRILTHSTAILGFLPIQICKSSMMVIIYNSTEIEENALIDDFLRYLDAKDRRLIKAAVDGFSLLSDDQVRDIQEMFFRYDMGCVLKADSFRSNLLKIARNELCVKPRALCEKIRQGIPENHFNRFWCRLTVDHIDLLHARLRPSAEKILNCIKPSVSFRSLSRRRQRVYEYFQEFIENLSNEDLQLLLQLITGQGCVPKRSIEVEFSEFRGVLRRPIFHTCSYMIELPDTYRNYDDLKQEMMTILRSDLLQFDLA